MTNNEVAELKRVVHLLEDRIKELELQLAQATEQNNRSTLVTRTVDSPGDPFTSSSGVGSIRYSPPGSASSVADCQGRRPNPLSPPFTPTASRVPVGSPVMGRGSTQRRHKRTETPEQLFLKPFSNGVKVYTMGMEPQEDRGLLHDFFDDIHKWAVRYTINMDAQEVARCSSFKDLAIILGGKSDIKEMLGDKEMRQDLVAALVIRDIVNHTIGEAALFNSDHHLGTQACDIISEFEMHCGEDDMAKHQLCLRQQALYKMVYEEPGHKKWRTTKADELTSMLLDALFPFLETGMDAVMVADCEHWLSELYVKGYRIGIRLRSAAVKWQVTWPVAGIPFIPARMINQTRTLIGDPMTTLTELMKNPTKYFVRFAMTPTVIKSDFSAGVEVKNIVHSSLVHVGRSNVFSHVQDLQISKMQELQKN
ncbi:hypothetical protein N0V90_009808 [Kalmusia sp. IMI 367209]|nr:hypothetical protein N0V90_009808 [Kalmusia sp. IMI 367209]